MVALEPFSNFLVYCLSMIRQLFLFLVQFCLNIKQKGLTLLFRHLEVPHKHSLSHCLSSDVIFWLVKLHFIVHLIIITFLRQYVPCRTRVVFLISSFSIETLLNLKLSSRLTEVVLSVRSLSCFVLGEEIFQIDFMLAHVFENRNYMMS
jgi:hypothetical protein